MTRKTFFVRDTDSLMDNGLANLFVDGPKKDISVSLITNSLYCLENKKNACGFDVLFDSIICVGMEDSYTETIMKRMIQPPNDELCFDEENRYCVKIMGINSIKTKMYNYD